MKAYQEKEGLTQEQVAERLDHMRNTLYRKGKRLGVIVVFDDALSRPHWVDDGESPILVVPGSFTPEQQGRLGAVLARHTLTGSPILLEEVA